MVIHLTVPGGTEVKNVVDSTDSISSMMSCCNLVTIAVNDVKSDPAVDTSNAKE